MKKFEIHTIRFGDPDWMPLCADSLDDYCQRHDVPLKIWDRSNINPLYPAEKFCEVDMLKTFLEGSADWIFYIDADTWVSGEAPLPDFDSGFHICYDRPWTWSEQWPSWCRETFPGKATDELLDGFVYRNAGIWACDRASAAIMLSVISEPYIERCQEQDQWNWWIALAKGAGMDVRDLSRKWNCFPREYEDAYIHHLAGGNKMFKASQKFHRGVMPHPPETFVTPGLVDADQAIVIPWKRDKAKWMELKYCIRSIQENFEDKDCPIYILGDHMPNWLEYRKDTRVKFLPTCLYTEALVKGLTLARRILWVNDDICILQSCGWDDFEVAPYIREFRPTDGVEFCKHPNEWQKGLGRAIVSLQHIKGGPVYNFSTHTPYLYERDKGFEILRRYGCYHKIPMETLYHNHFRSPKQLIESLKTSSFPAGDAMFLNYNDGTLTPELIADLESRFPVRYEWELKP